MTRTFLVSALIGFTFLSPAAVYAQEKAQPKTENSAPKKIDLKNPVKTEAQSAKAGPTGKLKEWMDAENKMIDPLPLKDQESIFILRNKHSMMKVTRVVEGDIESAVKSCSKSNPDMKDKMEGRFKQWQSAVSPILDTAEKQLDKDIDAQKIVDADDFKDVLELHDEAYEEGEKQTIKQPVATKEACEGLLASMDNTEDNMIQLLQQTLLPESAIRKRAADMEKAKAASTKKNMAKKPPVAPKPDEAAKTE